MIQLWKLFDSETKARPKLSPDLYKIKKNGLFGILEPLMKSIGHLERIYSTLRMIELSVGSEILISILKRDCISFSKFNIVTKEDILLEKRGFLDVPRCFSDIMGLIFNSSNDEPDPFWLPLSLNEMLSSQFLISQNTANYSEDLKALLTSSVRINSEAIKFSENVWDYYQLFGEYDAVRLGAIDLKAAVEDEFGRYDYPHFMCIEAAKIRF
jgi:hypothetical protein